MSEGSVCQVRHRTGNVTRMIRPTWSPANDEQRKALAEAKRLARQHERNEKQLAQAEASMWDGIQKARELGVPDTVLCDETGASRATLNRKFGKRQEPPIGG
jgi:hypothetical protein